MASIARCCRQRPPARRSSRPRRSRPGYWRSASTSPTCGASSATRSMPRPQRSPCSASSSGRPRAGLQHPGASRGRGGAARGGPAGTTQGGAGQHCWCMRSRCSPRPRRAFTARRENGRPCARSRAWRSTPHRTFDQARRLHRRTVGRSRAEAFGRGPHNQDFCRVVPICRCRRACSAIRNAGGRWSSCATRLRRPGPLRQPVSVGVLWRRLASSICLTRKSATSAREMNPELQSRGSTSTR
jgi:hypothetical protein